jgi:1-deoxy-D-xylulose 5-phosphate reductoisomerase
MASGGNIRKSARTMLAQIRQGKSGAHHRISAGGKLTAKSAFGVSMVNSVSNASLKNAGVKLG